MTRAMIFVAVLMFAFSDSDAVMAWHFHSTGTCMKYAAAPQCEPPSKAVCKSRRRCTFAHGKTINACAEWRCEPRK
jgi:hypothetical protein